MKRREFLEAALLAPLARSCGSSPSPSAGGTDPAPGTPGICASQVQPRARPGIAGSLSPEVSQKR